MMRTRCPACQTVFRLEEDQLRARKGMVRCGHCFHPFNAIDNEVREPGAAPPPAPRAADSVRSPFANLAPATPPSPAAKSAADPLPRPSSFDALDFGMLDDFPASTAAPPPAPPQVAPAAPPPQPEVIRSSRRPSPPQPASTHASAPETELAIRRLPGAPTPFDDEDFGRDVADDEEEHPTEAAHEDPPRDAAASRFEDRSTATARTPREETRDDVRAAHVPFEPRSLDERYGPRRTPPNPLVRLFVGIAVGLLGSVLAAQLVYLYRMEIGRDLPGLRPLLVRACAEVGCTVPLPHDIGRIVVEASELQSEPGKPGSYQLHLTVSNQADYLQAWPHLELTLTDGGDSPIARRVLTPEQWAGDTAAAEALAGRQVVAARIPFRTTTTTPTGYRLNVFYP